MGKLNWITDFHFKYTCRLKYTLYFLEEMILLLVNPYKT